MGNLNGKGPATQTRFHGTVVYVKHAGEGSYGFIQPAGSDGSREANVWFGNLAAGGLPVEKFDEVDYVLMKKHSSLKKNLSAFRIWVQKPCDDRDRIETLHGELEV